MKRDESVVGLLMQSIVTINSKNAEIERLSEELKHLKNIEHGVTININFYDGAAVHIEKAK